MHKSYFPFPLSMFKRALWRSSISSHSWRRETSNMISIEIGCLISCSTMISKDKWNGKRSGRWRNSFEEMDSLKKISQNLVYQPYIMGKSILTMATKPKKLSHLFRQKQLND